MPDEDEFVKSLAFEDLKKEYLERKKELYEDIDKRYKQENEQIVNKKSEAIEIDKYHRMVLNACIFPFSQDGLLAKYGYFFVRASPLSELGLSNLDFLILHPNSPVRSLFGEAKGTVNDPQKAIDQFKIRIKDVENNLDYIKQNYVKNQSTELEFVIGVEWGDSNEILKTVQRKGGNIKVWQTGYQIGSNKPRLSLVRPIIDKDGTAKTMFHSDPILTQKLNDLETSFDYKSIFPESHPFAKLRLLALITEDSERSFSNMQLLELVKGELNYLDQDRIKEETNKILSLAEKIGFLEMISEDRYKVISKGKRADSKEDELRKKWINFAIDNDKEEEQNKMLKNLQDEYNIKRSQRKTLADYFT